MSSRVFVLNKEKSTIENTVNRTVIKGAEKSDNCRIRTCAGKAQQISSLSP